ncbi:MAG: M48 family metalloprotease [Moraxella sp.]|nr:M48 family metalloprotease [Moraxella sp.]
MSKILFSGFSVVALAASVAFAHAQASATSYPNHSGMTSMPSNIKLPIKPNTSNIIQTGTSFNEMYHNRTIAEWSLQQINASLPQIHDPWVVDFVFRTTSHMNALTRHQRLFATPVINDKNINAFAVTGGVIAINTGVILSSATLDETASVLAHEIGHLSLRHYERNQDDKSKLMAIQIGGLLAAIAASAISGDGAAAMMVASQTMTAENAATHSRAHEREADRVGMALMAQAGFDAHGMPRFFDKLNRRVALNTAKGTYVPSFFQSHPFTSERLAEAHSRANDYGAVSLLTRQTHAKDFDLLSWRVKYLTKADEEELKQGSKTSQGAKMAYAAYLADNRRFDEARRVFDEIDKSLQDEPLYCISLAHMDYEKGDFAKAAAVLSSCHAIAPERRDLTVYLADSFVQAGEASRAESLLVPLVQKSPHDIIAQDLLQKAYEKLAQSNQTSWYAAKALYARASKELWRGKYDQALVSLTQAKSQLGSQPNHATFVKSIDAMMAEVRRFRDLKIK